MHNNEGERTMTTTKRVYLAGPIAGLTYEEATYSWREKVINQLGGMYYLGEDNDVAEAVNVQCYTPMRGKIFLKGTGTVIGKQGYEDHPMSSMQGIIGRDRNDVMNADLVFMNVHGAKAVSIGTTVELGWADAFRKPIVLILDKGGMHDHAFYKGLATYVCDSLEQGIECAKALLIPSAA
jgi:nucleoside 2-deoxyribosyltransferase